MRILQDLAEQRNFRSVLQIFSRSTCARTLLAVGIVFVEFIVIPRSPLEGPAGGVIALGSVLVCSWYGGPIAGALMPLIVVICSRFLPAQPLAHTAPTLREMGTFGILTVLTTAVGLAGQYRRGILALVRVHEARLRAHARALDAATMVFCDLAGRINGWSAGAERVFGWRKDAAEGQPIQALLFRSSPRFPEIWSDLLRQGQWQGESGVFHRDGRELRTTIHAIHYAGDDPAPGGVVLVLTDVTALREAEAAAREADRRKDVFLALLAHELRNPLAPLQTGLAYLARVRMNDPDEQQIRDIMTRQLSHLVRLIDDLLDLSRINMGKIELRQAPLTAAEIVKEAVEATRPRLDAAGHTLQLQLATVPIQLQGDRARLVQVLVNLLNNAVKFTPARGQITLAAQQERDEVVFRVRDTGVGIRSDLLPHVFDMFIQAHSLQTRAHDGLGIGLSIVRSLVTMHGGSVEAHSAGTGRGSEFTVRLPATSEPIPTETRPTGPGPAAAIPGQQRILVVDDNRDAASTLAMLLKSIGLETRTAYDGPSALRAADSFNPQTFVLDLGMPGMSGLELARTLRNDSRFASSLMIALTGWGKEEDRRDSRAAGFDHHLVKPVDFDAIRQLITQSPKPDHVQKVVETSAIAQLECAS